MTNEQDALYTNGPGEDPAVVAALQTNLEREVGGLPPITQVAAQLLFRNMSRIAVGPDTDPYQAVDSTNGSHRGIRASGFIDFIGMEDAELRDQMAAFEPTYNVWQASHRQLHEMQPRMMIDDRKMFMAFRSTADLTRYLKDQAATQAYYKARQTATGWQRWCLENAGIPQPTNPFVAGLVKRAEGMEWWAAHSELYAASYGPGKFAIKATIEEIEEANTFGLSVPELWQRRLLRWRDETRATLKAWLPRTAS